MAASSPPSGARPVELDLDVPSRLLLAAQCALPHLPDAVSAQLAPLLTPETMVVIGGSVAAVAAGHALGVGFAVDVALGAVVVVALGSETIEACARLKTFYELAVEARYASDFDAAGRELAAFVTILGINVVAILLTRKSPAKLPQLKTLRTSVLRAGWRQYVSGLRFKVPRDKGMLWSRLGSWRHAERLAKSKGLTSLEMLLQDCGFFELYAKQFGSFEQVKAAGLQGVTEEIWRALSRRYAASLEGKVTAFVKAKDFAKAIASKEPMLVDEIEEIAEVMASNPKISLVEMIDVGSGKSWLMNRSDVLKAVGAVH